MDKTKLALGVALVAVIIAIGGYFYPQLKAFGTISSTDVQSTNFTQLSTTNGLVNTAGAYLNNGAGVQTVRQSLVSGTSTPCAIQNPFSATSTVVRFAMNITTATSSAINYAVGTSTTAYATTTSMETVILAASQQSTLSWEPSVNNAIITPNGFVVVGSAGGTLAATGAFGTGIVIGGTCTATFETAS